MVEITQKGKHLTTVKNQIGNKLEAETQLEGGELFVDMIVLIGLTFIKRGCSFLEPKAFSMGIISQNSATHHRILLNCEA